ncbi:5'-nucleotidase C-terminal domain-containing protein, partial [candidate division WOR-3 bacterium]|nr:5'-nucleotidase C-terminal domain-containing protein [candidate division WOR-3 bacterium]
MSKKLFVISITLIGCILFHARCYGNELDHPVEIAIMTTADLQSCIVPYTVVIEGDTLTIGGARITIDTTQAPFCAVYSGRDVSKIINVGSRIINIEVYKNDSWSILDTSAIYTVLTNSWMAIGGDGHYIFRSEDIQKKNTTLITTDLLTSYIQSNTPVAPQVESRI